jgi:hypothetical protein
MYKTLLIGITTIEEKVDTVTTPTSKTETASVKEA